ncbi:MAG: ABC transporter permease [Candidatus Sulfopaludibacter sp.]|nr:ABC transporter permease [Candidatus Sulfopaludibacter sp.]
MLRDLAYAVRTLRKSPVFFIAATGTIALGIGASTAIFSVTNAVLLQPLPYKDPDRLVLACGDMRKRNVKDFPWSNAEFFDFRDFAKSTFEQFAAVRTGRATIPREDGTSEQVRTAAITPNFFPMMGGRIVLGRDFAESDGTPQPVPPPNQPVGAAPPRLPVAAVLSYSYFQHRYGGNPSILGRTLFAGGPQIVGVLAPGFELLFPADADMEQSPDYWISARLSYDAAQRTNVSWRVIGRLRPGVTLGRAQAEADAASIAEQKTDTILRTADFHARLEPLQAHLVSAVRPAILALMGAVIFLLLIACANVGNLMLVRVSLRERELAVRTALGGSWLRLVRQMLVESLVLASVGTALGVALAAFGIHELRRIAPASLPRLDSIRLDPVALAFSVVAGLAAAILFGLLPALRSARSDVITVLRASGRTSNLGGARVLRNSVVVVEVALSFVLLIGSGLMFRSFLALQKIDPGFDPHRVLTFQVFAPGGPSTPQQRAASQQQLHDRLAALPGVQAATASFPFPLTGNFSPIRWGLEPALADPSKYQAADWQVVQPGYFAAMRTPILEGREFADADNVPGRLYVMVDQVLAGKAFPHQSAVGKRILTRLITPEPQWVEIIGVTAHQRQSSLADPGREQIYFTDGFLGYGANRWALRTAGDPARYVGQVRTEIARFNPKMLVTDLEPMDAVVEKAQASTRFSLLLIGVFAGVAVLLAGVGLYGVLATVVRQRTAEIGVRMALGAAPGSIFSLVVGQGMRLSAAGIAAGLVAALALTRVMTTMLVGVKATDPVTYAAMASLFFAVAALACWIPAWRASALDPTAALRDE